MYRRILVPLDGPFDWRSVVAHGVFYLLHDSGSEFDRQRYARAIKALREKSPDTLTRRDPVLHRTVVFGIHVDSISGRAAHWTTD